jgi:hypothetical protein
METINTHKSSNGSVPEPSIKLRDHQNQNKVIAKDKDRFKTDAEKCYPVMKLVNCITFIDNFNFTSNQHEASSPQYLVSHSGK